MKYSIGKKCLFVLLAVLAISEADAQRTGRRRNNNTQQPAGNQQEQQQTNDTRPPSNYDPYGGIPIVVDSSGVSDTAVKKSLRNENAFDKSNLTARTPLPYEHLRWDDALFAEKVWRELDLREKMNQTFRYQAQDDNGSQVFIDMLLRAVATGEVTAFADERFTTPMTPAEVAQLTVGSADTVPVYDVNDINKIVRYTVTRATFDANTVTKLRIKEEWVFDREASRYFCRILGISPLVTKYIGNTGKELGSSPMFWIYYPDLRPILARMEVYNPKNMGQSRMTWEELFESRMFSSYIIKSSLDNPSNRMIKQYQKNQILALLEGEDIKEKLFNFEQDLWEY
ncbi:MAG: hypothetical protein ABS85_04150 [Sphingobacteriales bacterium SCN 48-20]|jgi:gliding motility associated protien GldN|uniref:type IX secretion system ring protein PorN/GldN n=1 Tax=Terrimonas ferruginea TaxID=249 RepID=UPI00041BD02B|nr:gliding motility protein GldN [Terrimonas ferruginea]MBN8782544.1 gliding motility protein GldN [Terrimonas ferruginea]ODT94097.1 MAG: hypothetical protein ABS85_04150 [Sphingobacteriales bacterium SCN 48-20]OJW43049.1 MAG: hypothetical protein BGO56_13575 [Sphingobacteriales bacterium 48-107]